MMEQTIIDPESVDSGFDYSTLPTDDAEFLRNKAAYINARRHITHQLITEMGIALIEAKERLPGVFLAWARNEFQFSDDTIENYMNVAAKFPALEQTGGIIQAKALYLLSRGSTPESVRTEAAELAGAGVPVDYKTAFILAEAPPEVKARYLAEELPKDSAFDLARVYKKKTIPQPVKEVCIGQKVSSASVVNYLAEAWTDYQATKGTVHERSTYADIEADGWTLNGLGWAVPISQAREVDIERFKVDRQTMRIDKAMEAFEWIRLKGNISEINGVTVLIPDDSKSLKGNTGAVVIDVRVKKQ